MRLKRPLKTLNQGTLKAFESMRLCFEALEHGLEPCDPGLLRRRLHVGHLPRGAGARKGVHGAARSPGLYIS